MQVDFTLDAPFDVSVHDGVQEHIVLGKQQHAGRDIATSRSQGLGTQLGHVYVVCPPANTWNHFSLTAHLTCSGAGHVLDVGIAHSLLVRHGNTFVVRHTILENGIFGQIVGEVKRPHVVVGSAGRHMSLVHVVEDAQQAAVLIVHAKVVVVGT